MNSRQMYWKYARGCGRIGGGLLPGAEMRIAELSKTPAWVRAEIPGSDPVVSLKIAGEERGANFRPIRQRPSAPHLVDQVERRLGGA
jgi:hypothetical protein